MNSSTAHFINGQDCQGQSPNTLVFYNPNKGLHQEVGKQANLMDIVTATQAAIPSEKPWVKKTTANRALFLRPFAEFFFGEKERIQQVLCEAMGYPQSAARGQIDEAEKAFHWALAKSADELYSRPLGLISIVFDGNSPLTRFFELVFPSLILGNRILMRPGIESLPLMEVLLSAWKSHVDDPGLLQALYGDDEEFLQTLAIHPSIRGAVCLASLELGQKYQKWAGARGIFLHIENNSRNSLILGRGLDYSIHQSDLQKILWDCHHRPEMRGNRVFLSHKDWDAGIEIIRGWLQNMAVEDWGFAKNENELFQYQKIRGQYKESGAEVAETQIQSDQTFQPVVFIDVNNCSALQQEVMPGPIVTVTRYKNKNEVVSFANNSRWGLLNYIFNPDSQKAQLWAHELSAGQVFINKKVNSLSDVPRILSQDSGRTMGKTYWNCFKAGQVTEEP